MPIGDVASMQFRAEAFNILNRVNYQDLVGNLGDARFGQAVRTSEPRQFQLSVRVEF